MNMAKKKKKAYTSMGKAVRQAGRDLPELVRRRLLVLCRAVQGLKHNVFQYLVNILN